MKKILNQDKTKKIVSISLLLLWCLLIFILSSRNGTLSNNDSGLIVNSLGNLGSILENIFKINITYLIRKLAHIFLYFILYFLAYNVFLKFNFKRKYILALVFCLVYAISDEFHQMFVINRTASIIDIFIDFLASSTGFIILNIKNSLKIKEN